MPEQQRYPQYPPQNNKPACPCWASCYPEMAQFCDPRKKPTTASAPPLWLMMAYWNATAPQQPSQPNPPPPQPGRPGGPYWPPNVPAQPPRPPAQPQVRPPQQVWPVPIMPLGLDL